MSDDRVVQNLNHCDSCCGLFRVEGSPRFVGLVNGKECYMEKM